MCARWEVEQGLLVEVKVRQLRMPRDLYLLYRRRGPLSHAAAALLKMLRPRGAAVAESADAAEPDETAAKLG
jgi:hypothetical protein